ncbi:MAG: TVP38/TMEM64 family protein [Caulobacteraceae bacterium]
MKREVLIKRAIFLLLLFLFVTIFIVYKNFRSISINDLKFFLRGFARHTPLVFMALCIARGLLAVPCGLFSVSGGILFGSLLGAAITLVSLSAGSILTFYLARLLGNRWTEHIIGNRFKNVDKLFSNNGFYSVFLMRVVPILPYDVVSCISGLSKVGLLNYILGTVVGSIPGVFIYVYFGNSMMSLSFRKIVLSLVLAAVFAITPVLYKNFFGAKTITSTKNKIQYI